VPTPGIRHVFVLMLENRSFDHMLGFSGITGTDAASGQPTRIQGLSGTESNSYNGKTYTVLPNADYTMPADPPHEFSDVLQQLCGSGATYPHGGAYPPIAGDGFVASYAPKAGPSGPGEIMKCYHPNQLPVLNALAREFAVCDNWFASMPGPTWPNRLFVHGASSGGLDHSPTTLEILQWEIVSGFPFPSGTIFDTMRAANVPWRLYAGDDFPMVAALKGIQLPLIHPYHQFAGDVARAGYPAAYTFIEPSYNVLADYRCSTSQHPLDDVTRGESLIKCAYESIRNSPLWNESLLILTWDEPGGFYDHVFPPGAPAPEDTVPGVPHNQFGFTFQQYGGRVPAVAISPLIPRNTIDHRLYDHASIPATLEALFGLSPMTQRDAMANSLTPLLSLASPRGDAPATLPEPAHSGIGGCPPFSCSGGGAMAQSILAQQTPVARPQDSIDEGNLPGVLQSALRSELALAPERRDEIIARFQTLKTREDAMAYLDQVRLKVDAAKASASSIAAPKP